MLTMPSLIENGRNQKNLQEPSSKKVFTRFLMCLLGLERLMRLSVDSITMRYNHKVPMETNVSLSNQLIMLRKLSLTGLNQESAI